MWAEQLNTIDAEKINTPILDKTKEEITLLIESNPQLWEIADIFNNTKINTAEIFINIEKYEIESASKEKLNILKNEISIA